MNVGYDELNVKDVAEILGVHATTITRWCRGGFMKYQDVSESGSNRPRYLFTIDEVNRVERLIKKYGKHTKYDGWICHASEGLIDSNAAIVEDDILPVSNPEDYIPDNSEIFTDIQMLRDLKVKRDKMLSELDNIDESIKTLREKIVSML